MKDIILHNKVKAVNNLYQALNENVPELLAELKKGYKINNNGGFDKRTMDRLKPILNKITGKDKALRAYIDSSYSYSKFLYADVTYKVGEFTVNYFKTDVYVLEKSDGEWIVPEFTEFKLITFSEVKNKLNEIKKIEKEIDRLNSKLYILKREALL